MNKDFLFNSRNTTDILDIVQGQLARQNNALKPQIAQSFRPFAVMDGHLRAGMQPQSGKIFFNQPRRSQILNNHAVGAGRVNY